MIRQDDITAEEIQEMGKLLQNTHDKLEYFLDIVRQGRDDRYHDYINTRLSNRYAELEQISVLAARLAPYLENLGLNGEPLKAISDYFLNYSTAKKRRAKKND